MQYLLCDLVETGEFFISYPMHTGVILRINLDLHGLSAGGTTVTTLTGMGKETKWRLSICSYVY